jgi:hypothetical protein
MAGVEFGQPVPASCVLPKRCHPKITSLVKRGPHIDSDGSCFQASGGTVLFLSLTDTAAD